MSKSGLTADPEEYWVIDACSVLWVKRSVRTGAQPRVYKALTALVNSNGLLYPRHVHAELSSYAPGKMVADLPLEWVTTNKEAAARITAPLDLVKEVLSAAPRLLDVNKPRPDDEADPYIAALA